MGFDGHIDLEASNRVEQSMNALQPTRNHPTAVRYRDTIVVYWRESDEWVACEFGCRERLPVTGELAAVIDADQRHAREKLLD